MRFVATLLASVLVSLLVGSYAAPCSSRGVSATSAENVSFEYFLQPTEQSQSSSARWKQRVLVNSEFASGTDAPTFVYLGPAGPLDPASVTSGYVQTLAKTFGARLVAPEHRFHGESYPVWSLELNDLKSLTVENSLGDVARLLRDFTVDGKPLSNVVLIGADFGATLAAWLRVRHPELSVGAVAASAIVSPQSPVFGQYYKSLARAVTVAQGGASACADIITAGINGLHDAVDDWHPQTDRAAIAAAYGFCGAVPHYEKNWREQEVLYESVFRAVSEGTRADKVGAMCELLLDGPDEEPVWRLGRYIKQFAAKSGDDCYENRYSPLAASYNNTRVADNASGRRQDLYLACNELGTFRVAHAITEKEPMFFRLLCDDVFGFNDAFNRSAARVASLAAEFGGVRFRGDKVIFANAQVDALASEELTVFESAPSRGVLALSSVGASRGAILGSEQGGSLAKDRKTVTAEVGKWLEQSANDGSAIVSPALLRSLKLN